MPRQEEHPHPPHLKHGQGILRPGQRPENLRMADIGNPAGPQGFLVDRCGGHSVRQSFVRQADAFCNVFIGSLAAHAVHSAHLQPAQVNVVQVNQVQHPGGILSFSRFPDHVDPHYRHSGISPSQFQHTLIPDRHAAGSLLRLLIGNGLQYDFRSDSGSVSHGDRDQRSVHSWTPSA